MTVLITGSSRGIGKAIAKAFNHDNHNIILNGASDINALNAAETELKQTNPHILPMLADLSNYEEARRMIEDAKRQFGSIDVLINNAGISHIGLFHEMKPLEWKRLEEVNLNSMLNCTHLCLPDMIRSKSGVIINISSVWGETGASCEAVYSMTKGGMNAFTKALARELGPSGIRVNAISCGVIETEMNSFLNEYEKNDLANEIPLMRFGKTGEVAALAVFMASENAAYMTGQIVTLDGGFC